MKIENAKIRLPAEDKKVVEQQKTRPSIFTEGHRGEYYNLDIEKLIPFRRQARRHFDEQSLNELAATIAVHGIRQPLTVIASDSQPGNYEVISGERRLRAAKITKLEKVPCIILHDYKSASEIAIIENIQREDLHPLELAKAYEQLIIDDICSSHAEISKKLGIAKSVVTETLGLLKLPEEIKELLLHKNLSARKLLRKLALEKSIPVMQEIVNQYEAPSPAIVKESTNKSGFKRKILLKVIQDLNGVYIDTNQVSVLAAQDKQQLLSELRAILKS